ncbi:VWA domain-containing protein [Streptomyces sp. NPDC007903]|uniref:VWA domain-containing protein n=1 Tax=Streptomyces sp. NPDC007903 TaxID=3364786 RepID=UPI0036F0C4BF
MFNPFKKKNADTAPATAPVTVTDTTPHAPVQAEPDTGVPAGLISLVKTAKVSLDKGGVADGQRAAVYLVVDRSGSMSGHFRSGAVQNLADQALGLSANLDDDGTVPLVFFDNRPYPVVEISLDRYQGVIAEQHQILGSENTMGGTVYTVAMDAVIEHYQSSGATCPALVIFQTDGEPGDRQAASALLAAAASKPIFWSFVGFGPREVDYLKRLDKLRGRLVDNASYFHAGDNPSGLPDRVLYDGLTREFGTWLTAARRKGLLP